MPCPLGSRKWKQAVDLDETPRNVRIVNGQSGNSAMEVHLRCIGLGFEFRYWVGLTWMVFASDPSAWLQVHTCASAPRELKYVKKRNQASFTAPVVLGTNQRLDKPTGALTFLDCFRRGGRFLGHTG